MIRMYHLLCVIIATHWFYMVASNSNDIVVQNLKLYVQGEEYFIKAVCYNPVPLGQGVNNADGVIGGGYCSPKMSPYSTFTTACYDSDYFDGQGDAPYSVQPPNGWFQPLWERDFPLIKALGVNTLRLYNANPTTRQASIYYPEVITLPLGKDHTQFMDMAAQFGLKVIFPLIADYGMMTSYSESAFKRLLRWQIDEVGNHSALLMWSFGNELPLNGNQALVNQMNDYMIYIKQYTFSKWGRRVPLTTAVVDNPSSYDYLASSLNVDVFTANAGYRGVTFTDLWAGNTVTQGWWKLSCTYNIPVFIGEMGWMSLNNAETASDPSWFNQLYQDLINHMGEGCIGGAFFEYSDEPLKADPLQQTMGLVEFQVNVTNGVPSTEDYVWSADLAVTKTIYNDVAYGSYNGIAYNMNSNVFSLIGVAQTSLGSAPNLCSSFALSNCPGTNPCSFHGICNRVTGTCMCEYGWQGADCSQAVCSNSCSGQGTCVQTISPPVCICNSGWTGPACNVSVSVSSCAIFCVSGNGNCDNNGNCVCYPGWLGSDCSLPDLTYPTGPASTISSSVTSGGITSSKISTSTSTSTSASTSTSTSTSTSASTSSKPTSTFTTASTSTSTSTSTSASTSSKSTSTSTTASTSTSTSTLSTTAKPTTTTTTSSTSSSTSKPSSSTATTTTGSTTSAVVCPSGMQSCGQQCYSPSIYTCYSGFLCPVGTLACGGACYSPSQYTCVNNQLQSI